MTGYLEGLLVLLAINTVFAYGAYLPLAAGQLNIGLAGFAAIGAYGSAQVAKIRRHPLPPYRFGRLVGIGLAGRGSAGCREPRH